MPAQCKGRVMNEKTKHTIAYHESGTCSSGICSTMPIGAQDLDHLAWLGAGLHPLHSRRGQGLNSLSEMKDELAVFMGGRVAEEIFCDDITTGASNDLERASKMARAIVTQYGMSSFGHPGVRPAQPRGVLGPRLRQHPRLLRGDGPSHR